MLQSISKGLRIQCPHSKIPILRQVNGPVKAPDVRLTTTWIGRAQAKEESRSSVLSPCRDSDAVKVGLIEGWSTEKLVGPVSLLTVAFLWGTFSPAKIGRAHV